MAHRLPLGAAATPDFAAAPLASVGTILLSWVFFWFTAQVATTFVLGAVPWRRSAIVGIVPTVTVVALVQLPPIVLILVVLVLDGVAIRGIYRVRWRTTVIVTVMHAVASISIAIPVIYAVELLATAPV